MSLPTHVHGIDTQATYVACIAYKFGGGGPDYLASDETLAPPENVLPGSVFIAPFNILLEDGNPLIIGLI